MGSVALEPAAGRSYAELAQIFNAGYEGYYTPFTLDEAAFRYMSTTWDDDLEASRVPSRPNPSARNRTFRPLPGVEAPVEHVVEDDATRVEACR